MAKKKKKKITMGRRVLNLFGSSLRYTLKWRYFFWALAFVFFVLVVVNHVAVAHWLGGIDWVLVKDYSAVVVSWPTAVLVLGLIFMYRFSDSIREFIKNIDRFKAPGIEVSQQQSASQPTPTDEKEQKVVDDLESKVDDGSVTLTKQDVEELVRLLESMDFKFLNLHLVQNTKNALRMMAQIEVRKSAFLQAYQVPPQVVDQVGERQAILNSLFEAQLIYEENDVLKASDRGLRFLAFIGTPV